MTYSGAGRVFAYCRSNYYRYVYRQRTVEVLHGNLRDEAAVEALFSPPFCLVSSPCRCRCSRPG